MTSTKDKLFALAAATGKMVKDGNADAAMKNLNLMAHLLDDQSINEAKKILNTLHETEPEVGGVEDHISSFRLDIDPNAECDIEIDLRRFTHDEALFILVTILGGALRQLAKGEDSGDKKRAAQSLSNTINMIAKWVTEEDWDKAHAMINNQKPPEDTFNDWLSA